VTIWAGIFSFLCKKTKTNKQTECIKKYFLCCFSGASKKYKMPRKKKLNKYPKFYLYACDCECVNECKKVFF